MHGTLVSQRHFPKDYLKLELKIDTHDNFTMLNLKIREKHHKAKVLKAKVLKHEIREVSIDTPSST